MRPPQLAAENRVPALRNGRSREGFNEAAATCGGKPGSASQSSYEQFCFNEAAATCGGKQVDRKKYMNVLGSFNEAAATCGGKHRFAGTL